MKQIYKLMLLTVLMALGVVNVKAELISLQEVPFCTWNGWGADAQSTGNADCAWVLEESTGQPYGDSGVNNYADLSNFTKLIVVAKDGTPRILLNRDADGGQFNDDESQSHLLEYPKPGTWVDKYFSTAAGENEGETVYTVDLKQIAKDKGFAHLHAIKGANWSNVTVMSMMVERQAKAPVGWTSIINNGNFEGADMSSFVLALNANSGDGDVTYPAEATEGAGVDGTYGLMVNSMADAPQTWSTQLFVKFNEAVTEGLQWRFTMDVKADQPARVTSGSHAAPRAWIGGGIIDEFNVNGEWQKIEASGTISKDLADMNFGSIAFDLNNDQANANTFYFDNISFEVFKLGTVAEFSNDVLQLDFGFDTNIPELVKNCGKKRLMFPMDCATVKVNGQAVELYSIEGFEDGRFYVFLNEAASEDDVVEVIFNNPADAAFHLVYASGALAGQDVKSYEGVATYNSDVEDNDGYPYDFLTPVVMKADPEDGSFNLPNSIKEFRLTFDKEVDCAALVATINGQAMTVTPAGDFASEITLTRTGDGDLATGEYTIKVTKIYPKQHLADEVFGDTTYVLNIGKAEYNPDDVVRELIPAEYFGNCNNGSIPEGFFVKFGSEDRPGGQGFGSGSRMFDFAAGGDFTKGLYFREGYVEYGTTAPTEEKNYDLELEAGKKYEISFNTAMWKDNGTQTCFRIYVKENYDAMIELGEEPVAEFAQVVNNAPNVNGSTGAVNGSTRTVIKFVPETTGKYVLRWVSTGSETGSPEYKEIILANPAVKYIPNQAGIEWIQLLDNALTSAKSTRDANLDERYDGADIDALVAAIEKYESEKDGYTNPSAYQNAADALDALAQAVKDHRALCDEYDANIKKTIDVERQNKENKFNATELYAQVVELNAKYHATSEWVNVAVPTDEDPEPEAVWQLNYLFDVLKDNVMLKTAIDELKDLANITGLLFTEGVSAPGDSNGGKGTGVAVLTDRIRLGMATLKKLGVADDDATMKLAAIALTDDDVLVEKMQLLATLSVCDSLAKNVDIFHKTVFNEETLDEDVQDITYDMTMFAKNHNVYKTLPNSDFTDENVPGWIVPEGYNRPGLTTGWNAPKQVEGIAEDCMFQTWGGSYRVEQTITNLPAGIYTIVFAFSDRDSADNLEDSYAYVKTSETPEGEEGLTQQIEAIGQAFPFAEGSGSVSIEGVKVTDGQLTIGANAGDGTHTFFNEVRILLTAAAAGYDYAAAAATAQEGYAAGVESVAAKNQVRSIVLYDLNGRRLSTVRPGITIVKKMMSDGTVRTEKVVRK
jgi:hypothetical protein